MVTKKVSRSDNTMKDVLNIFYLVYLVKPEEIILFII